MTGRKEFPSGVKKAALKRAAGRCEGCGRKLEPGRFAFDHDVPDGLGGKPILENCKVLCTGGRATCHGIKTEEQDKPIMRKADAQKAQANGLKAPAKGRFDRPPKPEKVSKPLPPRRAMFKEIE
jgi:5-methylcytosine-specific restriction protein A